MTLVDANMLTICIPCCTDHDVYSNGFTGISNIPNYEIQIRPRRQEGIEAIFVFSILNSPEDVNGLLCKVEVTFGDYH